MIKLGLNGGSLGDALFLTPAIHALNDKKQEVIVQMYDDSQCRAISTVFDGLCPVEFVSNPSKPLYHINQDKTHYTQRVLNELGLSEYSCIPKISLDQKDIDWAREYLKDYKNPLAIVADNSGNFDPSNHRAKYVCPRQSLIQQQVYDWTKEGFTVLYLISGNRKKFTQLYGSVLIAGLTIRQLAACYHVIGRLISGDTGNYHIALSVGAIALVLSPDESIKMGYLYDELHYKPELWKNEPIRCRYINYNTGELIYKYD